MADAVRIRYITEQYQNLQGLRLVPVGVACLAFGVAQTTGLLTPVGRSLFPITVAVALAALLSSAIVGTWYERRFGVVESLAGTFSMSLFAVSLLLILPGKLAPDATPVWPAIFVCAIGSLIRGCSQNGMLRHYLVIATVCFVLAMLEVSGHSHIARDGSLQFVAGISVLVAGIGDHAALRRALIPPTTGPNGSTI